jgi:hypothetical protein
MNRNFVGNIYGRNSIKIANFVPRFLEIDESETRIACGGHFVNGSGRN